MPYTFQDRVQGTLRVARLVGRAFDAAGPGFEPLLRDHGLTVVEVDPGVPLSSVDPKYKAEDRYGYGVVAGLYDPIERRIVIRSPDPETVGHEIGHAVDDALHYWGRRYLTGQHDPSRFDHRKGAWRAHPIPAGCALSPYSVTGGPGERFAEAFAAYLDAQGGTHGQYGIDRLRATDRPAAAAVRLIFRAVNGSAEELARRPPG